MNYYERVVELITEASKESKKKSYEIAKKHGLLQRGDDKFVDLPRGRQGVHNAGKRGEPGTGKGGREAYVTDDDGEEYPAEGSTPSRKKKRVKESVDSVSEAGEARAHRQLKSKNPDVVKKGMHGLVRSGEQQAVRSGQITPDEIKMVHAEKNDWKKRSLMRKAVNFAATKSKRDKDGRLKSMREFDKKPNK